MYVKNHISYIAKNDISIFDDVLETKFIQIDNDCVDDDRNCWCDILATLWSCRGIYSSVGWNSGKNW